MLAVDANATTSYHSCMDNAQMIGMRIKSRRTARGLSQRGLAKLSGITHNTISRLENGHRVPDLETLEKLAAAMSVTLAELT